MASNHEIPSSASDNSDAQSNSGDNKTADTRLPKKPEDTTDSGDAKNGSGEDNHNPVESDDSIHG